MNFDDDDKKPPPPPVLGSIPRKSLPPPPDGAATEDVSQPPTPIAASAVEDARMRQFKKPRHQLTARQSLPITQPSVDPIMASSSSISSYPPSSPSPSRHPRQRHKLETIRTVSEHPLIMKFRITNIPMDQGGIPYHRSSARMPKRTRVSYQENDDDNDLLMTDTEDEDNHQAPKKKRRLLAAGDGTTVLVAGESDAEMNAAMPVVNGGGGTPRPPAVIVDSPPPGVLNSLWYSSEAFLSVFVLEKVYGWKTRTSFTLVDGEGNPVDLPIAEASAIQSRLLANEGFFMGDTLKRLEVSRLTPNKCPLVLALAAEQARVVVEEEDVAPKYTLAAGPREEILLIKWRGRSHLHCSWERESELVLLDPSNNNTAKNKIRRYYQNQEMAHGMEWKRVMEDDRSLAATIHMHGTAVASDEEEIASSDDFFSPQCLEVERVMLCDESEMNMDVLARQRALNAKKYREQLQEQGQVEDAVQMAIDAGAAESDKAAKGIRKMAREYLNVASAETPWDPEDNVRYVVKWKGLPYSELTWEYWRDIKRDAVDEAEDFWYRQQAPNVEEALRLATKPHPHIREFRKLNESVSYGVSLRERPVADLGNGSTTSVNDDDEDEASPGFKLRNYQQEGVNWLLFNWWNKRSCILADEMGLGKTIQSAAFLQELQTQPAVSIRGPFLIVAPLSLIGQWESELKSWAPDINVVLYHGSADARDFLVQNEFYYNEPFVSKQDAVRLRRNHVTKFHVLITTYEVVLKDISVLSKVKWKTLIVDEAHRLKNSKAKLFEELASVPRDYCVLLTGTPIANATEELWALLHFANPSIFDDKEGFLEKFGQMTDAKQVNALHSLLKPYLLRRVKEDVEKSLPPKEETILEVSLTPIQKTFYKAIYERNTAFLYKGSKPSNAPSLMNVMMELRKCCNHPYLVKGAEDRIVNEAAAKLQDKADENGSIVPIDQAKLFGEQLIKSSGKMVLLEKLLHKLFTDGHKVLIFSQMVRVLDLLEELVKMKNYRYERLDGSTSSSSRSHAVDRFNRKSLKRFVMLLSTRAGGLGLNLTAADIVIIYDSDWNPQNDLQAMARAHRIGQTRAVQVFRLLTAKTYEMHMFHSASLKLGLERAVLSQNRDQGGDDSDTDNKGKKRVDREQQAKQIDELLKKGAYDVFREDDDREAEKFMETDIDQLLENSSKKVTYGDSATSSLGSGLGSFSKASFVASTDEGEKDVDLDDPDFWSKAIGLDVPVETPEDVAQMIDDGVKRSRKQVQVYDPYADIVEAEQMKKDQLALERLMEKEEKERMRQEKQKKKYEQRLKKKREMEEQNKKLLDNKGGTKVPTLSKEVVKMNKTPPVEPVAKPKKTKKSERQLAIKRAENEDPVIERIKQAWEVPQRAKATAAALRFGFSRFCKLRNESNLTSLPLQDIEIFVRCYVYQLALQSSSMLLSNTRGDSQADFIHLRALIQEWLGVQSVPEIDWLCESIGDVMSMQMEVESHRRMLRMPAILVEPMYVDLLRNGAAFRALRRFGVLSRINRFVEDCIDSILGSLGHEELGKRGCASHDLAYLDVDLKSRYVSTEELSLAISSHLGMLKIQDPVSWWDRSCDVGLLIGTFVHGLGNYETMRNDMDLPFAEKLKKLASEDDACKAATDCFRVATAAARQTFDDALESARIKAELEVQAAVAAAAKAASQREEDAANLRKGGAEAEAAAKNMPETQVENAFEYDGTDSHFVTLPRMQADILNAIHKDLSAVSSLETEVLPQEVKKEEEDAEGHNDDTLTERIREYQKCPMPDARVLDHRLLVILKTVEETLETEEVLRLEDPNPDLWHKSDDCLTNILVSREVLQLFVENKDDRIEEFYGVGISASQCGTSHRTLNDGCDYGFGSASQQLSQVAYGTDAPRFLRAIGVPMNITRFAISSLIYADAKVVEKLIEVERQRFFGDEDSRKQQVDTTMASPSQDDAVVTSPPPPPATDNKQDSVDAIAQTDATVNESTSPVVHEHQSAEQATTIPMEFRLNAKLRATVCLAIIFYGFPTADEGVVVSNDLWRAYLDHIGSTENPKPAILFSLTKFREVVTRLAPDLDVPDAITLQHYIEDFLLPHCLQLCVNGNGPTTRNARGSEGKYETAYGVSLHPEPMSPHPSPLPDPCMAIQEHSMEALGQANAILRRVRLLRTCQHLCSGDSALVETVTQQVVRSKSLLALKDMPVWWCPWIHDVGLLIEAATSGLFSVVPDRTRHPMFSPEALQKSMYSSLLAEKCLPAARRSSPEHVTLWLFQQAQKFPTLNQLERRLAFLCSKATIDYADENRFDCIPMFDHGGWPRN